MNNKNSIKGFTLLQLMITFAVVAILTSAAVLGIMNSRQQLALQNSVRLLASNMEKARLDAVKRHVSTPTSVVFTSPTSYNVNMDFGGSGEPSTRSFNLENGVKVDSYGLPSASFNWRGRTLACTLRFSLANQGGQQSWVAVSDAGDVTVNSDVDVLPNANFTSVNASGDIYSTSVVSGSTVRSNAVDCPTDDSVGVPGPANTGTGPGDCTLTADPGSQSIGKNGRTSGSITVTSSTAATISVTAPINLTVSPTTASVAAGGSRTFTVTSINNNRNTFAVNFTTACTTTTSLIKVIN